MSEKLQILKDLIAITNDGMSMDEYKKFVAFIVEFLKKAKQSLEDKNDKALEELKRLVDDFSKKLEARNEQRLVEAQTKMDKLFKEQDAGMNMIRDKMRDFKLPDPVNEDFIAEKASKIALETLLEQIPNKDAIKGEILQDGALIANSISGLLEVKDIKNLQEILDELRQLRSRSLGGGGFSKMAMDIHIIDDETPSEVPNGVITDFTLQHTPSPATSLKVFADGQRLKEGATRDYTLSDKTVTFNTAPLTDVIITFEYRV